MNFETGQGSALSAGGHHGVDQQTCEARAYAVARESQAATGQYRGRLHRPGIPLRRQARSYRAGLEDHFCAKLLGLPMGCDVCYTNHAEADQDDMDSLLTLLGAAGINFIMGIPGADDIMLNYQSTSFHDALYLRNVLGLKRAPEFDAWLARMAITGTERPPARDRPRPPPAQATAHIFGSRVMTDDLIQHNPGRTARAYLARIALGRGSAAACPPAKVLKFGLAHAQAARCRAPPAGLRRAQASAAVRRFPGPESEQQCRGLETYPLRPDHGRHQQGDCHGTVTTSCRHRKWLSCWPMACRPSPCSAMPCRCCRPFANASLPTGRTPRWCWPTGTAWRLAMASAKRYVHAGDRDDRRAPWA